jgi:hypothetical protein
VHGNLYKVDGMGEVRCFFIGNYIPNVDHFTYYLPTEVS